MIRPRSAAAIPAMSEADFQRQVTDLATIYGWEWVHFRPAQTRHGWRTPVSGSLGEGWVDLTLVRHRDARLLFCELKSEKGVVSARQAEVLDILRSVAEVHVWRPSDLASGEIAAVLR